MNDSTIFAFSTPLNGAIAVIRLSGDGVFELMDDIFTKKAPPCVLCHGELRDGNEPLDDCMAVRFKAPHSYTGEDMAELHIHGSIAIASALTSMLIRRGLRAAEPGEFTKRAFLNDKMDMTRAEAVMDLISSTSREGARSALLALRGALLNRISKLYDTLLDVLSELNARIDYPEEFDETDASDISSQLNFVLEASNALIETADTGRLLREGALVVIVGTPNAGKSSLLNALLNSDRAIVTSIPGTTRDIIIERTVIHGCPVRLVDTAGVRDEADIDEAERIGIKKTRELIDAADLLLVTIDASAPTGPRERAILSSTEGKNRLIVLTKGDIVCGSAAEIYADNDIESALLVSSRTGDMLEELKLKLVKALRFDTESQFTVNARQKESLMTLSAALKDALSARDDELIATDVRTGLWALSQIIGRDCDANMIDRIFSRFCVGK